MYKQYKLHSGFGHRLTYNSKKGCMVCRHTHTYTQNPTLLGNRAVVDALLWRESYIPQWVCCTQGCRTGGEKRTEYIHHVYRKSRKSPWTWTRILCYALDWTHLSEQHTASLADRRVLHSLLSVHVSVHSQSSWKFNPVFTCWHATFQVCVTSTVSLGGAFNTE